MTARREQHIPPVAYPAVQKSGAAAGGLVAGYVWDEPGGGDPIEPILTEMRALGVAPTRPPSVHASRMEALHGLWTDAGLEGIETRAIRVQRSFDSFDNYWQVTTATGGPRANLELMEADAIAELKVLNYEKVKVRKGLIDLVILATEDTEADWEEMPWLAGQGIGLIHDIPSVTDAVERMMAEASNILGRLSGAIRQ
jgi:NAD(P)H-dependent flavin oxidoreductase YrpB (nitropropane dioxygenase family)